MQRYGGIEATSHRLSLRFLDGLVADLDFADYSKTGGPLKQLLEVLDLKLLSPPPVAMKCRLCHTEAQLCRSHILPDFFRDHSGSYYPTGESGQLQPFTQLIHTTPGRKYPRRQHGFWERQQGMVEHLLCNACEQKLSAIEDYAKRYFYGNSSPLRLQIPILDDPFYHADYKQMKLFQLSLLWRSSEAKGPFFEAVKLTDSHRENLRLMLLNDTPGSEDTYFCAMSRLMVSPACQLRLEQHSCAIETGSFAPVAHNHGKWDIFTFVMGGLVWDFCVSDEGVPEFMQHTYIKESGRFYLSAFDGNELIYQFSVKTVLAGNLTKEDAEESVRAKQLI